MEVGIGKCPLESVFDNVVGMAEEGESYTGSEDPTRSRWFGRDRRGRALW